MEQKSSLFYSFDIGYYFKVSLEKINSILEQISSFIWGPITVFLIILTGLFLSFFLKAIQFRGFLHALKVVFSKKYNKKDGPGNISHFQALCTALSSTVGLGNIAGVALAIQLGGPGACFWMIVCGFLGMTIKYCECSLSTFFREIDPQTKQTYGGPMYYMAKIGKNFSYLGFFYAVCCCFLVLGAACLFQSNQVGSVLKSHFSIPPLLTGLCLCALTAFVIIGGIKRIAEVTEKIVPFMILVYVFSCLIFLGLNFEKLPQVISSVFTEAFNFPSASGGFFGYSFATLIHGLRRGVFSSEAGLGTASIAHAAASTNEAFREGFVSLLEPFIDTVLICTLTALVVITGGLYMNTDLQGVNLTVASLNTSHEILGTYFVPFAVSLFCYSTLIGWFYYAQVSLKFLFKKKDHFKKADFIYKIIYCIFIVIGPLWNVMPIINFTDIFIAFMLFPNLLTMWYLSPFIKKQTEIYFKKYIT